MLSNTLTGPDADSILRPADVFNQFAISPTLQSEGRAAGQLTYMRDETGVRYRGAWVSSWIADGLPIEPLNNSTADTNSVSRKVKNMPT